MFIGPCGGKREKEGKGRRHGVKEDLGERDQSGLLSALVEMSPGLLFLLPSYLAAFSPLPLFLLTSLGAE